MCKCRSEAEGSNLQGFFCEVPSEIIHIHEWVFISKPAYFSTVTSLFHTVYQNLHWQLPARPRENENSGSSLGSASLCDLRHVTAFTWLWEAAIILIICKDDRLILQWVENSSSNKNKLLKRSTLLYTNLLASQKSGLRNVSVKVSSYFLIRTSAQLGTKSIPIIWKSMKSPVILEEQDFKAHHVSKDLSLSIQGRTDSVSLKYIHTLEHQQAAAKFKIRQILKTVSTASWAA